MGWEQLRGMAQRSPLVLFGHVEGCPAIVLISHWVDPSRRLEIAGWGVHLESFGPPPRVLRDQWRLGVMR
jgi:hypothetical protein